MQQWEYQTGHVYELSGNENVTYIDGKEIPRDRQEPLPAWLARVGAMGWELVSTHSAKADGWVTYIFKRPKE